MRRILFIIHLFLSCSCQPVSESKAEKNDQITLGEITVNFKEKVLAETPSFRGLSAVDAQIAWVGGSLGAVYRTTDGGENWDSMVVPGAEKDSLQFRDVKAWSAEVAVVLAAGEGKASRIYWTEDGGKNWLLAAENSDPQGFWDALDFWDEKNGIVMGDPLPMEPRSFFLMETQDGGKSWQEVPPTNRPLAMEGEAAFAASGTCLVTAGDSTVWICTGGKVSRLLQSLDRGQSWEAIETGMRAGKSSEGAFSIGASPMFFKNQKGKNPDKIIDPKTQNPGLILVGGDYEDPTHTSINVVNIAFGPNGKMLSHQLSGEVGYLSCVSYRPGTNAKEVWGVGPDRIMWSKDGGITWKRYPISEKRDESETIQRENHQNGFHAISFSPDGKRAWVSGSGGRVGWLNF